jgi:hypothetical protein
MKITLCGSMAFAKEILDIKEKLLKKGHEVFIPLSIRDLSIKNVEDAKKLKSDRKKYIDEIKPHYTREHFNLIENSDAILVVNLEKHGIENYIGGATFSEIMLAFHLNKKIFLLNPIPNDDRLSFIIDEIEATKPIILHGNLEMVK